jgi:hypothetical protein
MINIFDAGLVPDRENANAGTQRGRGLLEKSLRKLGAGRSILTDKDGNVIAGNKTLETAADIDLPVRIVETDGRELVVVRRTDLDLYSETDKRGRQLAYADNKISEVDLAWKPEQVAVDFEPLELEEWGFGEPKFTPSGDEEQGEDDPILLRVPDAVWGTDNDYGIPLLDLSMQATYLEAPFAGWGTMPRKNRMTGTYHFYVEDYRFENVWKHPEQIAASMCAAVIEPNFSVYDDMPRAVAIWQIYRKRWIARWLQSVGIKLFVDMNISERHADLRLMGVPRGWKAYCTRSYFDRLDSTEREYREALAHSESESILFVVYGGGKKAEELSKIHGWIWYPDQQTKDAGGKNG